MNENSPKDEVQQQEDVINKRKKAPPTKSGVRPLEVDLDDDDEKTQPETPVSLASSRGETQKDVQGNLEWDEGEE